MSEEKYFEKVWAEIQEEKNNPELRRQRLNRDLKDFQRGMEFEVLRAKAILEQPPWRS